MLDFSISHLLINGGYSVLFLIIFVETALPICFFFPGDSLLFVAGFYVTVGKFSLWAVIPVAFLATLFGGFLGYYLGKVIGKRLFGKYHIISERKHKQAEAFYKQYGVMAVILTRFIPVVRSFMPAVSGIAQMDRRKYTIANTVGAIAWVTVVSVAGFFVGRRFPVLLNYVPALFTGVIVLSLIPVIIAAIRSWKKRKTAQKKN